jgi:hypothetical protein
MGSINRSSAEKILYFDHPASPEKAPSLLLCSIIGELVFDFFKENSFLYGFELPGGGETPQV